MTDIDTFSQVLLRYQHERTYACDFYGHYIVRVAHHRRGVAIEFDPSMTLTRGSAEITVSKKVARRLGLALLRASLEDEQTQDILIQDESPKSAA